MTLFQNCLNSAITAYQNLKGEKITDRELAETFGCSNTNLSRWRNGQINNEGADLLIKILSQLPPKETKKILNALKTEDDLDPEISLTAWLGLRTGIKGADKSKSQEEGIHLNNHTFKLKQLHKGLLVLGNTGSGKTHGVLKPILTELIRKCRKKDGEYAKIGGLIYDFEGEYLPQIIRTFQEIDRPLTDLIIISPETDTSYNPLLDPTQTYEELAKKLFDAHEVQTDTLGKGDNQFWTDTTQVVIQNHLKLLGMFQPTRTIGFHQLLEVIVNEVAGKELLQNAKEEIKKQERDPEDQLQNEIIKTIDTVENQWITLAPHTKEIIKATMRNMLQEFQTDLELQEKFCSSSAFSFQDVINEGKLVIVAKGLNPKIRNFISACLKTDFQIWTRRRTSSSGAGSQLEKNRTIVLLCDECPQVLKLAGQDEAYAGITRSNRVIQILSAQCVRSIDQRSINRSQVSTFLQNMGNILFLRNNEEATLKLAQQLGAEPLEVSKLDVKFFTPGQEDQSANTTTGILHQYSEENQQTIFRITQPLNTLSPQERETLSRIYEYFRATLISLKLEKSPPRIQNPQETKKLYGEELEILRILELIRKDISQQFPELRSTPYYRMLLTKPDQTKDPKNKGLTTKEQYLLTISWSIQAQSKPLYAHIRETIRETPNLLPEDLKSTLAATKNEDLLNIFKRIKRLLNPQTQEE